MPERGTPAPGGAGPGGAWGPCPGGVSLCRVDPVPQPSPAPAAAPPVAERLRSDWLTLLLGLLGVYVLATATLPALLERGELRERRAQAEEEISRLSGEVRLLQDWNEGAASDPLLRERLLEAQRLSPEAAGYRELPDPQAPPAKAARASGPSGG